MRNAGGDADKLREIGELSDDETLRKWLWSATIIGAPACFIGLPLVLGLLGLIFSSLVMQVLWFMAKASMAVVLILFGLAVYLTWRNQSK